MEINTLWWHFQQGKKHWHIKVNMVCGAINTLHMKSMRWILIRRRTLIDINYDFIPGISKKDCFLWEVEKGLE